MTDKHQYALETLTQLREEVGTSTFDHAIKAFNRQRLENGAGREKRKAISWSKTKSLYQKCKGVCWWCGDVMPLIRGQIEADHFDPNAMNFNDESNLGVMHKNCNREKGAKSIIEQAEYLRITVKELIERFNQ